MSQNKSIEFEKFENYLGKQEIKRRLAVPFNSEQNMLAERKNIKLVESARCFLIDIHIPLCGFC